MNESAEINLLLQRYYENLTYEANKIPFSFIEDEFTLNLAKKRLKDFCQAIDDGCLVQPIEVGILDDIFKKTAIGADLGIDELSEMQKYLSSLQSMKDGLEGRDEYEVKELYLDLVSFPDIEQRLKKSITADLEISSEASVALSSIRKKIEKLRAGMDSAAQRAQKKYESYLADTNITFRNGYSTIAVSSTNKNKVGGVVASTSATGQTSYIIPSEVLALSSEIAEEEEKEQEEIYRIIQELSRILGNVHEELVKVFPTALLIDKMFGAVLFGKSYNGTVAEISANISFKDLGHPLLNPAKMVCNDMDLNEKLGKVLLISGPNAGGKTVFLKSVQIAAILNQAGLLVPAAFAALPIFDGVFFLSGDNQSVLDNLSTFSSHVGELKNIAEKMTGQSLVIIDEIGQGTSPLEGSALGVAFIARAQSVGSYLIMTSHYEDLKDYCLENTAILSAKMVFDEENMLPTFKIDYGVAGHSFGLAVAAKLGLPDDIIATAKNFVRQKRSDPLKQNLDLLNKRLAEVEDEKRKLDEQKSELEKLTAKRTRAVDSLKSQQAALREKENEIIEKAVEEKLRQIDTVWKSGKDLGSFGEMSKIKGNLKKMIAEPAVDKGKKRKDKQEFEIGDAVRIALTGQAGIIKEKRGSRYKIDARGLTVSVEGENLELIPPTASFKKPKPSNPIDRVFMAHPDITMELNIIGQHYDEAENSLKQYLDSCLVARYHRVRIVHGVGSGVLQKLTWKILSQNKNVESYAFGGQGEGGVGSTVVYFK